MFLIEEIKARYNLGTPSTYFTVSHKNRSYICICSNRRWIYVDEYGYKHKFRDLPKEIQYLAYKESRAIIQIDEEHYTIHLDPGCGKLNPKYYEHLSTLEQTDSGTIVGYKILYKFGRRYQSPYRSTIWSTTHQLTASMPKRDNTYGIYGTKTWDNPELENVILYCTRALSYKEIFLVKFYAYGKVIEAEFGIRAQKAKIAGVRELALPMIDGDEFSWSEVK